MALVLKWPDGASRSGVLGGNGDESFFFFGLCRRMLQLESGYRMSEPEYRVNSTCLN